MYGEVLFLSNSAGIDGGAIYSSSSVINITGLRVNFSPNSAQRGGAMFLMYSNLTMYGRELFEDNSAGMEGGATYSANSVINMHMTGRVDFNQDSAQRGGAMFLMDSNLMGAAYSLNSVINMTGRVDFNQNSAQRGGAMAFAFLVEILVSYD